MPLSARIHIGTVTERSTHTGVDRYKIASTHGFIVLFEWGWHVLDVGPTGGWVTEPSGQFIAWYLTAEQPQVAPPGAEAPAGSNGDLLHLVQTWRSNTLWTLSLIWGA
jgi:hypothetical protein